MARNGTNGCDFSLHIKILYFGFALLSVFSVSCFVLTYVFVWQLKEELGQKCSCPDGDMLFSITVLPPKTLDVDSEPSPLPNGPDGAAARYGDSQVHAEFMLEVDTDDKSATGDPRGRSRVRREFPQGTVPNNLDGRTFEAYARIPITISLDSIIAFCNSTMDRCTSERESSASSLGPKGPASNQGPTGQLDDVGLSGEPGRPGMDGRCCNCSTVSTMLEELIKSDKESFKFLKGPPGPQGPAGPEGRIGPQGLPGEAGLPGPMGLPGDKGSPGSKGLAGSFGYPGVNGSRGPMGPPGAPGNDGAKGKHGPKGQEGDSGLDGLPGSPGQAGQEGERGAVGRHGPKGDEGDQGKLGSEGFPGRDGTRGPNGQKGDKGDRGIAAGMVQLGNSGESAVSDKSTAHPSATAEPKPPPPEQVNSSPDTECLLKKIGYPEDHAFGSTFWGSWMQDTAPNPPYPDKIWVTRHLVGDILFEYQNMAALQSRTFTKHNLANFWAGTGHVIFNNAFYYHTSGTQDIIRYDLMAETVTAQKTIPNARYRQQNVRNYLFDSKYTFMDITVDDNGLWVIYKTAEYDQNLVVSKLDPIDLSVTQTVISNHPPSSSGDAFIICGRLYTTKSSTNFYSTVDFAMNLFTGEELPDVDIPYQNQHRKMTMMSYNPRKQLIYAWDMGHMVTYNFTLIEP